MGKLKNMQISQQEEEEILLAEERQKREEEYLERKRLFEQDEVGSEDDETGFDFERDQGAMP